MDIDRWRDPVVRGSDWAWRILVLLALGAVIVWAGISLAAIVVPTLLAVVIVPVGRPLTELFVQQVCQVVLASWLGKREPDAVTEPV